MNPTTAQGLDPQLKATYDRVMGTELPKTGNIVGSTQQTVQPPAPSAPPVQAQSNEPTPAAHTEAQVFVASPAPSSQQAFTAKKTHKISPVVWIVLAIAFFGVYTGVWLKVFGIV